MDQLITDDQGRAVLDQDGHEQMETVAADSPAVPEAYDGNAATAALITVVKGELHVQQTATLQNNHSAADGSAVATTAGGNAKIHLHGSFLNNATDGNGGVYSGNSFLTVYDTATPAATPEAPAGKEGMPVVVRGLNLEIAKGEYVAFTGSSGCGKSTVLKLLLCLYPLDQGERYLVCQGRRQPLDGRWQRLFAYVPQGNHLMTGTVRQIVALGDPDQAQDEARLHQALEVACAADFVAALDQGVDTPLGERGAGLSEGQLQRLAIARAIFSQRPVLLLDECTSALDAATERQLLVNLRRMTQKTVILVTHRPEALNICDRVIEFTPEGCTVTLPEKGGAPHA